MTPHQALLKAQEEVRPPKYNDEAKLWIVRYREDGQCVKQKCKTETEAWEFFYKKLREIKTAIMSQLTIDFEKGSK